MKPLIEQWWRGDIAKKLKAGVPAIPRDQTYALHGIAACRARQPEHRPARRRTGLFQGAADRHLEATTLPPIRPPKTNSAFPSICATASLT